MLRKFKYIIPLAFAIAFGSCKKSFFDINVDPNNPSSLPVSNLLPQIEASMGDASAISTGISAGLEVYMHRITVREAPNVYGITGSSGIVEPMWDTYYRTVLTNADIIIDQATEAGNFKYAGIAKIIKAYSVSQLVDVFGDVPFTEAIQLVKSANLNPKFDDDASIYPALLQLIDSAIADLNNPAVNLSSPGTDDVIYGGNIINWVKAANTLKLKMYTQMRLAKDVSPEVTALLADPANLISNTSENFQLPYNSISRNPGFSDYTAAQRTQDISPWFYEILKGYNPSIFTGITDPRIPYYFFNQVKRGQDEVNDNNATEYRDSSFVSIYFGSNGEDVGRTQQNTMTVLGLYPVGGKFDAGEGGSVGQNSGTGAAPYRFITYADRLYLEAELIKAGVIAGDAKVKTLEAITESFKQVDAVVANTGTAGIPVLTGSPEVVAYINRVMAIFDADVNKQLEIIMIQKWISSFGSAVDAYTDYRRTGFPVLFDPNNPAMAPGGKVQPPVHGNPLVDPQKPVPVSLNRPFPLSLPWPTPELTSNKNAPPQKEPSTYKVFWQP